MFTITIIALFNSCAKPTIFSSCSVTPSVASIIKIHTSALSTAASVLITEYLSISSLTLLFLLRPAVSINVNLPNSHSILLSIASLVVPAISDTINLSSPNNLFIKDDFPTLGLPIIAIFMSSSSSSFAAIESKCSTTISSISPSPFPCPADTATGSPIPKL